MRVYKTELAPNNIQRTLLLKSTGVARFAYNYGLNRKQTIYEMNQLPIPHIKYPTAIDLNKEIVDMKHTNKYSWLNEVSKCCPQEALRDLDVAYYRFFKHISDHPKMKSKKNGVGSFTFTDKIQVSEKDILIPRIGRVKLKERNYLPTDQHILSATVSEHAGRWFVSVLIREEHKLPNNNGPIVGVDLNIAPLAMVSDETVFANPKALRRNERKLKKLQRSLSRKAKGSRNRNKARQKVSKIYAKIANIRKDNINKVTTILTKTKSIIGIEDLNNSGMLKNHKLAKSLSDASFGEFRRQLEYKAKWYGSIIVIADRWFPSTKKCCKCGKINEIPLGEEIYTCSCGNVMSRHLNAAKNLESVAVSFTETLNACGEEITSMNQEPNTIYTNR